MSYDPTVDQQEKVGQYDVAIITHNLQDQHRQHEFGMYHYGVHIELLRISPIHLAKKLAISLQ